MGFRKPQDNRVEHRLRRIEAQLHDIVLLLEHQTSAGEAGEHSVDDRAEIALREVFRELEAEQQDIQISLRQIPAANDCLK
jgi:hypothetical protein